MPQALMQGPLVYVMGPSGAGKDSVMGRARALLPADAPVVFAHRYITRPAETGGENHIALNAAEFALRRTHGLFAFHWQAHGNDYGIGREIYAWRSAGLDDDTYPVLITASPQCLAERLATRGREDADAAALRIGRSDAYEVTDPRLATIMNDGALDEAAKTFVSLLATLQCSPDVRRRA